MAEADDENVQPFVPFAQADEEKIHIKAVQDRQPEVTTTKQPSRETAPEEEQPEPGNDNENDKVEDASLSKTTIPQKKPEEVEPGRPNKFRVYIEKGGQKGKLGLDIFQNENCLQVNKIKSGFVKTWNEQNPEKEVRVGDLILEVNGIAGDFDQVLQAILKDAVLDMLICHTGTSDNVQETTEENS